MPPTRSGTSIHLEVIADPGLGNSTYLLDLADGRALVVDASRDLRSVRSVAERRGLQIAFAADTHLHADFLSGSVQLAADDGATVLASRAGEREFPHVCLDDGGEIDLGGLTLRALSTPGHTHEHLAFEILDGRQVVGVFTGGSLLVGAAARTDLVSPDRTEELARAQYRSLQRLAELDDDVEIWPTHGAGSFCSAPPGSTPTTIGTERATNKLLRAESEDAFVEQLLDSLGSYPAYFRALSEINRRGPDLLGESALPGLSVDDVPRLLRQGAVVIDVRPVQEYAAAHLPDSVSIPLRAGFATWLGWLTEIDQPWIVVRDSGQDADEIVGQAAKIGYDDTLLGELVGGVAAWSTARQPVSSTRLVGPGDLGDAQVLDIRQRSEYDGGHLPAAAHLELGDLATSTTGAPDGPTVVMCGHGERAMSAASLLARAGHEEVAVLVGGPDDWAAATGHPLVGSDGR